MKAQDILTDESKWTKGTYARNSIGRKVSYNSESACKFCLFGALWRVYGDMTRLDKIERRINKKLGNNFYGTTFWNDAPSRTFAEVRALIEELDI